MFAAPTHIVGQADPSRISGNPEQVYLIIRSDDAGMIQTDSLLAMVDRLHPRCNLVVTHVGIDDAELGALLYMNKDGALPEMSKTRQGELDALASSRFRDALKAHNVRLLTYRQLIAIQGLQSMQRPEG